MSEIRERMEEEYFVEEMTSELVEDSGREERAYEEAEYRSDTLVK